jgi:hypothetical protein
LKQNSARSRIVSIFIGCGANNIVRNYQQEENKESNMTIDILVLLAAGVAALFGSRVLAGLLLAGLFIGPVVVQYFASGDSSLGYEAVFRLLLSAIGLWAAAKFLHQDHEDDSSI